MKIKKPYVILNGLKWSLKVLEVHGQTYFTYKQAIDILNDSDRRIPTKEEFEELIKLPNLWDDEKKGILVPNKEKVEIPVLKFGIVQNTMKVSGKVRGKG